MKRKCTIFGALVLVGLFLSLIGPAPLLFAESATPGVTKTEILVGATNGTTGGFAEAANANVISTKAWFEKVNKEGGIYGRKIRYIVLDDATDPQRAITNAKRLLEGEKVLALVQGVGSATYAAVKGVLEKAKATVFFPYAAYGIMIRPPSDAVFGILPLYDQQLASCLPYIFKKAGPGKVMMLTGTFDVAITQAVKWATEQSGSTYLGEVEYQLAQAEYGPQIIKLKAAQPDYVVMMSSTPDAAKVVNEMERQGYRPKKFFIGTSTVSSEVFLKGVGPWANDMVLAVATVAPEDDPVVQKYGEALKAAGTPKPLGHYTIFGGTSADLFCQILKNAGPNLTRESMLKAAKELDVKESGVGPVKYHPTHMLARSTYVVQIKNHKFVKYSDWIPLPQQEPWVQK